MPVKKSVATKRPTRSKKTPSQPLQRIQRPQSSNSSFHTALSGSHSTVTLDGQPVASFSGVGNPVLQKALKKEYARRVLLRNEEVQSRHRSELEVCKKETQQELARLREQGLSTHNPEKKKSIVIKAFKFLKLCHNINQARQGTVALAKLIGIAAPLAMALIQRYDSSLSPETHVYPEPPTF